MGAAGETAYVGGNGYLTRKAGGTGGKRTHFLVVAGRNLRG